MALFRNNKKWPIAFLWPLCSAAMLFGATSNISSKLAANDSSKLTIQSPSETVILRHGSGSARLTIHNGGKKPVALHLKAGVFTDNYLHTPLANPALEFSTEAGGDKLPAQLAAGASLPIVMKVSNLAGSSSASAKLFNQTGNSGPAEEIGQISALAVDIPLNLTIDGAGSTDEPVPLVYGSSRSIALRNAGSEYLVFNASFELEGKVQSNLRPCPASPAETGALGPNGTARLTLAPPTDAFSFEDRIRPSSHTGHLLLTLCGPADVPHQLLPVQSLPVDLKFTWYRSTYAEVASTFYVALILLLGGIFSIGVSSVLPNTLTKLSYRSQMSELANRTSSVSTKVDSYVRVLLRLERKNIEIALDELWLLSPSAVDGLAEISKSIDSLGKRLSAAERLDELRRCFESISEAAPPSITDDLDRTLQSAANQLHSFSLANADLEAAGKLLKTADTMLATINDENAMARRISDNFAQLKTRFHLFHKPYLKDLREALPGIFKILDGHFEDPKNVVMPMFFAIDHGISAMHIAMDYAMVRASAESEPSQFCVQPDRTLFQRVTAHECELLDLLRTLSWKALRHAVTLVQQMRENIYESDVLEQMTPTRATIAFDTQRARPYLPVFFFVLFRNSAYQGAAAVSRLNFYWHFPEDLPEIGVKVCHYFKGTEPDARETAQDPQEIEEERWEQDRAERLKAQMGATRRLQYWIRRKGPYAPPVHRIPIYVKVQGQGEAKTPRLPGSIPLEPRIKPSGFSRLGAEFMQFSVAFVIALAGLVSGALDQLAKLDLLPATVAIFALGFGANSIKNILTKSSEKPPAPSPAT